MRERRSRRLGCCLHHGPLILGAACRTVSGAVALLSGSARRVVWSLKLTRLLL
ncbi:hypothetical protein IMCC9480_640 [Oxalobacteraceae bacterium IMCC9480]|nr:hypothetical protein IMCC9480_640 [Oxalobacteraceae bacterium IMCC9480]